MNQFEYNKKISDKELEEGEFHRLCPLTKSMKLNSKAHKKKKKERLCDVFETKQSKTLENIVNRPKVTKKKYQFYSGELKTCEKYQCADLLDRPSSQMSKQNCPFQSRVFRQPGLSHTSTSGVKGSSL